ncbi:TadE/TadG family type IV pilus assembly protein [Streptomyces indonesiensis]
MLERARDDRGAVTTEIVLVLPLLFTLVLVIAQVTVWAHATHMAQATASHALSATRVEDGTVQSGRSDAQRVLDQLGHGPLRGAHISVTRDVERASVRVEGTATSVVPFLHLPVHAEAAARWRSSTLPTRPRHEPPHCMCLLVTPRERADACSPW